MSDRARERLAKNLAALEKRYNLLEEQQDAANTQLDSTLDRAQRVLIEQGIKDRDDELQQVECRIEAIEAELAKLDSQLGDPNRDHLDFESRIHKIDYTEVRAAIARLIERARADCAATLFLLPEGNVFGASWCLDAVRETLAAESFNAVTPRRVGFPREAQKDRLALLDRLAEHFNAGDARAADADAYASAIARRIVAATHIGSTELIEIHGWDYLHRQDGMLDWFLRQFWTPLIEAFRAHEKRNNARLLVVLVADGVMELAPEHCCDDAAFDERKLLRLQLRNWRRDEIESFLRSGAVTWAGLETIEELTGVIFDASRGGLPRPAYEALRKHVFNEV
jgi:hypothetical protein